MSFSRTDEVFVFLFGYTIAQSLVFFPFCLVSWVMWRLLWLMIQPIL